MEQFTGLHKMQTWDEYHYNQSIYVTEAEAQDAANQVLLETTATYNWCCEIQVVTQNPDGSWLIPVETISELVKDIDINDERMFSINCNITEFNALGVNITELREHYITCYENKIRHYNLREITKFSHPLSGDWAGNKPDLSSDEVIITKITPTTIFEALP